MSISSRIRPTRAALAPALVSLGALAAAVAVAMVIVALSGSPPWEAVSALWQGSFGGRAQVAGTLSKTVPLLLVALGWIVAFSTRRVNIGFEGQILIGGLAATLVALGLDMPAVIHLPLAIAAGILGGAAYAGIAAALWARRGVNEIISTLMLNFVAIEIISWLVRGPMQESGGGFPRTDQIPASAAWPRIVAATALSWDLPLVVALAVGVAFLVRNTSFGFNLRATGDNEPAARAAGVRTKRITVLALLLSGGFAGLAGSSLILGGEAGNMADNFSAGYGFEGIVVALLARNSALASIPAALVLAALRQGGGLMEARVGVPSALVGITQGVIIIAIAGAAFFADRAARTPVVATRAADDTVPANA